MDQVLATVALFEKKKSFDLVLFLLFIFMHAYYTQSQFH
jgi:hypothetical protein